MEASRDVIIEGTVETTANTADIEVVADKIGTGTGAQAICHAGIVRSKSHAERSAGLERGDSRILPSPENLVGQALTLKERKVPHIGERQDVALVEV